MGQALKDKVAIVTGAGRGIGRGVALFLAQEGAKVVVNDPGVAMDGAGTDQAPASLVVDEIKGQGGTATANFESIATMQGGQNVVQQAISEYGKLDVVVTCHGILRDRMIYNMTEEEWDTVIEVHLKGTFTVVRYACEYFRNQRSGCIITFSSLSGLVGNAGQANYGAAKDGIAGFTRMVSKDMGHFGVTVNSVAPSANTRMFASIPEESLKRRAAGLGPSLPATIRGEPEDVAPFVAWLASDQARDVNGNIFYVSSGLVSLLNYPLPVKSIRRQGRWTVEELVKVFPATLGVELYNPAPPQE